MNRRILFVCMQMSPHACRWISALEDRGWDLHVFPCNAMEPLPSLRGVTLHRPLLWPGDQARAAGNGVRTAAIFPFPLPSLADKALSKLRVRLGESDATSPLLYGPHVLARLVRTLNPSLIHSMEFQHNGYRVMRAREILGKDFPPWLATNWGSDIYHFRHEPGHLADIRRLLGAIDYYSCECHRDVRIARELGMTAKVMPVMPNSGGFDIANAEALRGAIPTSRRRLIMVKGYQHFAGRALTALEALERCADVARNFDIVIFSPSREAIDRGHALQTSGVLPSVTVVPFASHEEILRLHSLARVYLGVSASDAISTSALEAMAMGGFPIQTNTSCCDEWFEDGVGGYLVPVDDVTQIASRLRKALTDDELVDNAAAVNWNIVVKRLDNHLIKRQIYDLYDQLFADVDRRKSEAYGYRT